MQSWPRYLQGANRGRSRASLRCGGDRETATGCSWRDCVQGLHVLVPTSGTCRGEKQGSRKDRSGAQLGLEFGGLSWKRHKVLSTSLRYPMHSMMQKLDTEAKTLKARVQELEAGSCSR